jgi:FtsP/CotA-like multicopper oxidase with cupredoxin domain
MRSSPRSNRREFLFGVGATALVGGRCALGSREASADVPSSTTTFRPDVEIALRAAPAQARILPGAPTDVWAIQGQVTRGDGRTLESSPNAALGPTFRVRTGQKLRVTFDNELAEQTILHWHGLNVPVAADGHPRFAIPQGGRYVYEFEVKGPASTYWYHAHPDGRTGEQVYRGLAGLLVVSDPHEGQLSLPSGPFDVGLVIQDRLFSADNQLVYLTTLMDRMRGVLGDRILVNGVADYVMRAVAGTYRLRLVNASNGRIYRIAWADGSPLTVIATDGGLLDAPVRKQYAMLAPAERIDLWVDFGERPLGSEVALVSLPFDGMTSPGPMGSRVPPQGAALTLLRVKVDRAGGERLHLPTSLATIERYRLAEAVNARAPRRIVPTMQHMSLGINGRTFEMNRVAPDERAKLDTLEAWEFDNTAGFGMGMMGMMGRMPHPFHVHGGQFQVVRREGVTHTGYVDTGWKDTVLVMPGEKATILKRYLDYTGVYLYHCHNLEHEDAGMMRNFAIDP